MYIGGPPQTYLVKRNTIIIELFIKPFIVGWLEVIAAFEDFCSS